MEKVPCPKKCFDVLEPSEAGEKEGEKKCLEHCRVESLFSWAWDLLCWDLCLFKKREVFAVSSPEKPH